MNRSVEEIADEIALICVFQSKNLAKNQKSFDDILRLAEEIKQNETSKKVQR